MRVIRSAGQNVSPSDDGRLFDQIFSDGLFTETSITNLGGNNISIGAMYGDLCGRDFTTEAQTLSVVLPEGEGESTGYIYVEIDTSSEDVISVNSALAPFTPTYEDINTNGAVAQMIIAEYTATNLNVTSVTATYSTASAGGVEPGSIATIERSPATANHSIGEFIVYNSKLYKVIAAIVTGETLVEGTNIESASVGSELQALNNGLIAQTISSNNIFLTRYGKMRTLSFMRETVESINSFLATLPTNDYPNSTYFASLFKSYAGQGAFRYAALAFMRIRTVSSAIETTFIKNDGYNDTTNDAVMPNTDLVTGQITWFVN